MSLSHDLFALITSLTKAEKRHFKLTVSPQKGEKNYLRLFDAIDQQREYDEEALRRRFAGEPFIRQLHVTKRYLYDALLHCLRAYHDESSANARINNLLHEAAILRQKGLREQALERITRAQAIAEEHHLYHREIEVLRTRQAATPETVEERFNEEMKLIGAMENVARYKRLEALMLLMVVDKGVPRNEQERNAVLEIMNDPLMKKDIADIPLIARIHYYNVRTSYHYSALEFAQALPYARDQIALLESSEAILEDWKWEYIAMMNNFLILLDHSGHEGEFLDNLEKLKAIATSATTRALSDARVQAQAFNCALGLEFSYHMERCNFERCRSLIAEIESGLVRFSAHISETEILRFHYLFAQINLITGRYQDALRAINIALAYEWSPTRRLLYNTARVMNLLIHYELENLDLLEHQIKSTYRFLRKQSGLYKMEEALLRALRRIPALNGARSTQRFFEEIRGEIAALADDPFERVILYYFDFISWLDSKIERKPYREILERNRASSAARGR